ncbi:MAG TPA: hypothetical protein VHM91_14925 [Verrucomicrobiales bacterium]|nr:hypothetical protein [Verrucomicrobiales bacterium]
MNRSPARFRPKTIGLLMLAALSASCKREESGKSGGEINPQAKAYLEKMARKEEASVRKGWVHVEGKGFHYKKPEGWAESSDLKKGVYFLLTAPQGYLTIRLTSRYIESIPEGVRNLRDWAKFQYVSAGMPEAITESHEVKVTNGDALEARVTINEFHLRSRYFMDIFRNPEKRRSWLLVVQTNDQSRLESSEVEDFLKDFQVQDFHWLPPNPGAE